MKAAPLTAALLLVACSLSGSAKDKHLPLPPQLLSARTLYIENRSMDARIGDRAYQEIKSWGRFQVVQDKSQAELILLLTAHRELGARPQLQWDGETMNSTSVITHDFYSELSVLDAKTAEVLWTESKRAASFRKSAIKRAVDELRKRIEEETAEPREH